MTHLKTVLTAAAVAAGLAACNNPESAPEPENEAVAEAMPETPDMSDTTAGDAPTPPATGAAPAAGAEGTTAPEKAPAY
ncbi:hypothetical protein [Brevundimonas sp.]|uniref:hypothetical protein n=1 Tax=Brevundimonas sp. TaxID=1871086 RepID=UPI002D67AD04|nr:hypothetical protein [Brevundimonas sp.]HYC69154.1 hypothetical protein [Brevundimonas sp.]